MHRLRAIRRWYSIGCSLGSRRLPVNWVVDLDAPLRAQFRVVTAWEVHSQERLLSGGPYSGPHCALGCASEPMALPLASRLSRAAPQGSARQALERRSGQSAE